MDASRFDALSRSLSLTPSRRLTLRAFAGLLVGGTLGRLGLVDAEAKKKGGKKGNDKKCPPCRKKKQGQCNKAKKPDGTPCGTGKICQSGQCRAAPSPACPVSCAGGNCSTGACVCPAGTELCGGNCVGLCTGATARNPFSCVCCQLGGGTCPVAPATNNCCSGVCTVSLCVGGSIGAACTFGAQCGTGVCTGGFCA